MTAPIHATVAAYVTLALAIQLRNGYYSPAALALVIASLVFLVIGGRSALRTAAGPDRVDRRVLALGVALLAISAMMRETLVDAPSDWFTGATKVLNLGFLVFVLVKPKSSADTDRTRRRCYWALVGGALALSALVLVASPQPRVDVWVTGQESAGHLLSGLNPYRTPVSNPYGTENFGYTIVAYMYPPTTLYLQVLGHLLGDIRVASVAAYAFVLFALWWLLRGPDFHPVKELMPLLFLGHPRSYVLIEQAWTELLLIGLFAAVILLYTSGHRTAGAVAYGLMLSVKQTMAFFVVPWLLLERRAGRLALGALAAALTMAPFVIWDPASLWEQGILFHFKTAYRPEALTIFAPFAEVLNLAPTRAWNIGVGAVATAITFVAFRRLEPLAGYLWAVSLTTLTMFLFGNKAFANYYYLVGGLLVFLIAVEARAGMSPARKTS